MHLGLCTEGARYWRTKSLEAFVWPTLERVFATDNFNGIHMGTNPLQIDCFGNAAWRLQYVSPE